MRNRLIKIKFTINGKTFFKKVNFYSLLAYIKDQFLRKDLCAYKFCLPSIKFLFLDIDTFEIFKHELLILEEIK